MYGHVLGRPPCWAFIYTCLFLCYSQAFFPCVSSFPWLIMTPMSLALPMQFPLLMIILSPNRLLWSWLFSFINVWFRLLLICLLDSPSQLIFPPQFMTLRSWVSFLVLVLLFHPFCKRFWMSMFVMVMCFWN